MTVRLKLTRVQLALIGALLLLITPVPLIGIRLRWYVPPYPAFGKQVAWDLGYPEAAYNFDAVVPGKLYRSALPDARFIQYIHRVYGVQHIVSLVGPIPAHDTARKLGIKVTVFYWLNGYLPPPQELNAVLDLTDGLTPLLIHCKAGRDRTGYAVAAYRLLRQKWHLDQAVNEMKRYWHEPESKFRIQEFLQQAARLSDQS